MDMYSISQSQVGYEAAFASKPAPTVEARDRRYSIYLFLTKPTQNPYKIPSLLPVIRPCGCI